MIRAPVVVAENTRIVAEKTNKEIDMLQELDEPLMLARKLKEVWEGVGVAMNLPSLKEKAAELEKEQNKIY